MAFLLATLLAANPVILFLVTTRLIIATVIPVLCIGATQWAVSKPRFRLVSVYLFNFIALGSVFLHAEAILVHVYPEYVIENLYTIENRYYFNRPNLTETFTSKEYSVQYRTNVQGFRIGEGQDPANVVDNVDWLVLGDSFTQGAQVDFEELFTTRLYERFPDKIIVNVGISGLGIGHEYNYFVNKGQSYRPTVVILQLSSFNDFMNVEPQLVGLTDRLMTYSAFIRFLLADLKFRNPAALPLGRWTEPFYPTRRENADYNIFFKEDSPRKKRDIELFTEYLARFKEATDRAGSRLLVVLLPTKEQTADHYLEEVIREFSIDRSSLDMDRPSRLLAEQSGHLGIEFLDLREAFRKAGARAFFDYDEHMTALGHHVMADAIGDYMERTRGTSPVRLLSKEMAGDRYPTVSVDGQHVAYQSFRDGNMELFLASRDFSTRTRLTFNDVDESHPMLSRDGSRILFTEGDPAGHRTRAVIMNLDGSGRRALTPEGAFGAIASFSPTDRQIAYAEWTEAGGGLTNAQIALMDIETGQRIFVTSDEREYWRPVFSPDGLHLAFIGRADNNYDLYTYDLTSYAIRRLTQTPFDEWDPQFTPDGRRLVYSARRDGNWDLFLYDLAAGATVQLTRTKGDEWDPYVAPDGTSLLFAGRFGVLEAIFQMPLPR